MECNLPTEVLLIRDEQVWKAIKSQNAIRRRVGETTVMTMVVMCLDAAGFVFKGIWLSATVLCRTNNVTKMSTCFTSVGGYILHIQIINLRKCLNVHSVCTNCCLNVHSVCTNLCLNVRSIIYYICLLNMGKVCTN